MASRFLSCIRTLSGSMSNINHYSSFKYGTGLGVFAFSTASIVAICEESTSKESQSASTALKPKEFVAFTLAEKINVSHNTNILRFKLPEGVKLGMVPASFLWTRAEIDGKEVQRPYTPISRESEAGHFDLLVKHYEQGVMSKHLNSMKPGQSIEIKGPVVKFQYRPNMKANIGMIAGGSGITPMYQVILAILENPKDKTEISLIYANVSEKDILLKPQLDALAAKYPNFSVHYVLDKAPENWEGSAGFVDQVIVEKYLPASNLGESTLIMVCGPPGMMNQICGPKGERGTQGDLKGVLRQLSYLNTQVHKF